MEAVTDPAILAQLNGAQQGDYLDRMTGGMQAVTDPVLLAQLNGGRSILDSLPDRPTTARRSILDSLPDRPAAQGDYLDRMMAAAPAQSSRALDGYALRDAMAARGGQDPSAAGSQQSVMGIASPKGRQQGAFIRQEYGTKPLQNITATAGKAASMVAFPVASAIDNINGDDTNKAALSQSIDDFTGQQQAAAPDPSVGPVGHFVRSVEELAPMVAAGPAGVALIAGEATTDKAVDLLDKGVSAPVAAGLGALSGLTAYGMTKLPFTGSSVGQSVARGATMNPLLGIAERATEKGVLTATDYDQAADQVKILDPKATAQDVAMGVIFGLHGAMGKPLTGDSLAETIYPFADSLKKSEWYRGLTVKERGLVVLSVNDLTRRGWSEADLAKMNNTYFQDILAKRAATEVNPNSGEPTDLTGNAAPHPPMVGKKGEAQPVAHLEARDTPVDTTTSPVATTTQETPVNGVLSASGLLPPATYAPETAAPVSQPAEAPPLAGAPAPITTPAPVASQPAADVTPLDVKAHEAATSPHNDTNLPTPGQIEAGNYQKGHVSIGGLNVSIENPQDSTRSGIGEDGQPWQTTVTDAHYGYVKGSVGADSDHVDVFVKPGTDHTNPSQQVYVVDQVNPKTGAFDEHKALVGFSSEPEAKAAYLANYDQTGPQRIGAITETTLPAFKEWLKDGDTKSAFAPAGSNAPATAPVIASTGNGVEASPQAANLAALKLKARGEAVTGDQTQKGGNDNGKVQPDQPGNSADSAPAGQEQEGTLTPDVPLGEGQHAPAPGTEGQNPDVLLTSSEPDTGKAFVPPATPKNTENEQQRVNREELRRKAHGPDVNTLHDITSVVPLTLKAGKEFVKQDIAPAIVSAGHTLLDVAANLRDDIAPTVFNPNAKDFAVEMNRVYGNLSRQLDVVIKASEDYHKMFAGMSHSEKMDFMAGMHLGTGVDAALEPVAKFVDAVNDQLMRNLHAVAPDILPELRENYFTAIFKPSMSRDKVVAQIISKTPWEGGKGSTKQRKWDDVREAEAAGLELVSDNPMDILALHVADVQRTIGARTIMKMQREAGDVILKSSLHKMPEGFAPINDRSAEVWRDSIPAWKVQELIAKKTLKPLALEEFGKEMFDNPDMKQELDDLRWKQPDGKELNVHAMKNGTGKSFTQLVIEKMMKGQQDFADHAPNLFNRISELSDTIPEVQAAQETPAFENEKLRIPVDGRIKVGDYVMKADQVHVINNFLSKSLYNMKYGAPLRWWRSAGNTLNMFQLIGFFHANFVTRDMVHNRIGIALDDVWRAITGQGSWKDAGVSMAKVPYAPFETLKKGKGWVKTWNTPGSPGEAAELIAQQLADSWAAPHMDTQFQTKNGQKAREALANGNPFGAAVRGAMAFPEWTQRWLMSGMVPNAKTGAKGILIERAFQQHPNWTAEQRYRFSNDVGTVLDASMGQVNYSRIYMKKGWLNTFQNLLRAPGWTGGTWYLALKSLPEAFQFAKEWKQTGKAPEHLPMAARYVVSVAINHMLIGAMLTMLYEKGDIIDRALKITPQDLKFYRTNNLDEHGRPERFASADYVKDVVAMIIAPGQTLLHKGHPLIGLVHDLAANKDYRNVEIAQRDDAWTRQKVDQLKYVAEAFMPFMCKGIFTEMQRSGSLEKKLLPMIGEVPVPNRYVDTPFEAYAHGIANDKGSMAVRTRAEADKSQLKRQIANEITRDGKSDTAKEAYQAGKVTVADLKSAVKMSQTAPAIKDLHSLNTVSELLQGWEKASDAERQKILVPLAQKANRLLLSATPEDRAATREQVERLGAGIRKWQQSR